MGTIFRARCGAAIQMEPGEGGFRLQLEDNRAAGCPLSQDQGYFEAASTCAACALQRAPGTKDPIPTPAPIQTPQQRETSPAPVAPKQALPGFPVGADHPPVLLGDGARLPVDYDGAVLHIRNQTLTGQVQTLRFIPPSVSSTQPKLYIGVLWDGTGDIAWESPDSLKLSEAIKKKLVKAQEATQAALEKKLAKELADSKKAEAKAAKEKAPDEVPPPVAAPGEGVEVVSEPSGQDVLPDTTAQAGPVVPGQALQASQEGEYAEVHYTCADCGCPIHFAGGTAHPEAYCPGCGVIISTQAGTGTEEEAPMTEEATPPTFELPPLPGTGQEKEAAPPPAEVEQTPAQDGSAAPEDSSEAPAAQVLEIPAIPVGIATPAQDAPPATTINLADVQAASQEEVLTASQPAPVSTPAVSTMPALLIPTIPAGTVGGIEPVAAEVSPAAPAAAEAAAPPALIIPNIPVPTDMTNTGPGAPAGAQPATAQPPQPAAAGAFGLPGAAAASGLIALDDAYAALPSEDMLDVNKVLDTLPGMAGGPSEGGFSWHTLEVPKKGCWRRVFLQLIKGYEPKKPRPALNFGSLYHACWEVWYATGGQRSFDEPCEAVRLAGAPIMAGHVKRLVLTELQLFAQLEADTWDIRGVEKNAVAFLPARRIEGKLVHLPISCRHDLLISPKLPGAACAPAGPAPNGIIIVDRKTAGRKDHSTTKGYGMDGQFLTNDLVFRMSGEEEEMGQLISMIFAVAIKHKKPTAESYHRVEVSVSNETRQEFLQDDIAPWAAELYRRVANKAIKDNEKRWPKNRAVCRGTYGLCPYYDVCDEGGQAYLDENFWIDKGRILSLDKLWEPDAAAKRRLTGGNSGQTAAVDARKARSEQKAAAQEMLTAMFLGSLSALERFQDERYLGGGADEKRVLDAVQADLSTVWAEGTQMPDYGPDPEGRYYTLDVRAKAMGWQMQPPPKNPEETDKDYKKRCKDFSFKGSMTYKALAEAMIAPWFSIDNLSPDNTR